MTLVYADPAMLDRVAQSMDNKATGISRLKSRAAALNCSSQVSGLTAIAAWLGDTAGDLRRRARILRSPSESPFASLSAFGLPTRTAKDAEASAALASKLSDLIAEHKNESPQERAQAVKTYFASLSPEQQAALASAEPAVVGNLDGAPPIVRYAANRISIQHEYTEESRFLSTLSEADPAYARTKARVNTLRSFMSTRIKKFRDPATGIKTTAEAPRQFLVFDAHFGSTADPKSSPFPDGRVAEVVGDLETAENVAIRVPGITNRLDNFNGFTAGGYALASDSKGFEQPDTAVVSWLGYDTPELGDSVNPIKSEVGGRQLNAFRQGLAVNLRPDATTSIFAHSYGTLVTSKALQDGLTNIDNVTFMGSPGLGPNIHSVADFHMPDTNFFALRAPKDLVSYTEGLGEDPADFDDITRLDAGSARGHSQYYGEGTEALLNMRRILFLDSRQLTFAHTSLEDEMVGASEVRDLIGFLRERIPQDVVTDMGSELDPLLQDVIAGRKAWPDMVRPLSAVLNKYNVLDRVEPEELMGEVTHLGSSVAFDAAFKKAKEQGASNGVALTAATSAKMSSAAALALVTWPIAKALEADRLQNNIRRIWDGHWRQVDDGTAILDSFQKNGSRIAEDTSAMATSNLETGARLFRLGFDLQYAPSLIDQDTSALVRSLKQTKDTFTERGGDIVNSVGDTWRTTLDKGSDIVETGKDNLARLSNAVDAGIHLLL